MDSFMNIAKKGYEAYQESQSDVSKTGGQEYNSPHHSGQNQSHSLNFDQDEVVQTAQNHGSGDSSLFSSALSFIMNNKERLPLLLTMCWWIEYSLQSSHEEPIDEEEVTRAHEKVYQQGEAGNMSASSLGSAAAMQVLKQFVSGSGGSSGSKQNSQSQLMSLAMAEATKLFDNSGGASSGNKQDAVNGAAMTAMKLLVQSKFSGGTIGGSNSGGISGLLSAVSQFTK